jgi:hypothetical protein
VQLERRLNPDEVSQAFGRAARETDAERLARSLLLADYQG